ncbi:outer membrane lipoprotein [Klebsiella aerogenes]|jgi:Predicted small periplasmic lipoprotein|nr:outer membrane lipoprotein [Klebsiella aerogenes UCI 48]EUL44349.1 outer membrane lipoprotein [Klebsiella aerogenes UCI 47]EUL45652.1 outer membrane lipoprotein [Klebsiella aerogenes UCI 46]EUL49491.1 outer membrane lipoprotein [Klebsiella aerogenes UCI 45]EUL80683.1 outer membrane lipoprotein [Klebsiella aerogenes UCI 27]EUL82985.1 outer membrane lipoprotein [Klebsiella aerogenes UCI 28]EUL93843.1 outer membrane lipoprotein [Klebsiella aerogenes UCI 16]EUM00617.1 outer membrane lipoprote
MNHGQLSMKNVLPTLAVLFAIFSLTGCGLKGPLYFPPADKTAPPPTKPVNPGIQSATPDRNDRGDNGGPTQVNY